MCLMVGLPWGQFQGWSISPMWVMSFFISLVLRAVPIITDFRQALEANICLTREGRHITPGLSLSIKISSSMSWGPKVQFLLVGKEINLALLVTGAPSSITKSKPFFLNISRFSMRTASLTAVKLRVWGLKEQRGDSNPVLKLNL